MAADFEATVALVALAFGLLVHTTLEVVLPADGSPIVLVMHAITLSAVVVV